MSVHYQRLPDLGAGLRLHLNENTGGCSPRVLDAMRAVTREQVAFYPDYAAVVQATARWLGLGEDRILLTNGLDEGIHLVSQLWLQRGEDGVRLEAVVVEPAFDMYAACTEAAGGRVVPVAPRADLAFPLDRVLAALTPRTRVVFLTSPNNPTGLTIPRDAIHAVARAVPADAVVLLDEAYVDFASADFLDDLPRFPNVLVGRTFAKAHGLAAVRVGVLAGAPSPIARLSRAAPPYSLNVFAMAGLMAALEDREYLEWYRREVSASKALVYEVCERLGLHYWASDANFVLVRIGDHARSVVERLGARGIFIRDRSNEPGCAGCVRITAGVVEHTRRCVAALEEVLCRDGR
jgi:histidinol-phosphate aminotransferase